MITTEITIKISNEATTTTIPGVAAAAAAVITLAVDRSLVVVEAEVAIMAETSKVKILIIVAADNQITIAVDDAKK